MTERWGWRGVLGQCLELHEKRECQSLLQMSRAWEGVDITFRSHVLGWRSPPLLENEPLPGPFFLTWECTIMGICLRNITYLMCLLTLLCISWICTSAGIWLLFESNDLYVNYSTLMIMIIMIYHILFSILIKDTPFRIQEIITWACFANDLFLSIF